jgi:hypothetical protein
MIFSPLTLLSGQDLLDRHQSSRTPGFACNARNPEIGPLLCSWSQWWRKS